MGKIAFLQQYASSKPGDMADLTKHGNVRCCLNADQYATTGNEAASIDSILFYRATDEDSISFSD